ncbi:MAG TPA: hypothetical protein VNG33_06080 [Polyangiaceae bacterium]|nr:hypothetical protein [Polyangiaceae bacterium]
MDITALPTDTLFKFTSVGSVLLIAFVAWRLSFVVELDQTKRKQALAIELGKLNLSYAKEDLTSAPTEEIVAKRGLTIKEVQLKYDELELTSLNRQLKYNFGVLSAGVYVALVIGSVGFGNWSDKENKDPYERITFRERVAKVDLAESVAGKARIEQLLLEQEHPTIFGQLVPPLAKTKLSASASSASPQLSASPTPSTSPPNASSAAARP